MHDGKTEVTTPPYRARHPIYWKERSKASRYRAGKEVAGVTIFENEDKLSFSQLERKYFKPKHGDGKEWWCSLHSGDSFILSFRNNSVNLYLYQQPKDKRKKWAKATIRNYTRNADVLASILVASKYECSDRLTIHCEGEALTTLIRNLTENILRQRGMLCNIPTKCHNIRDVILSAAYPVVGQFLSTGIKTGPWDSVPYPLTSAFRKDSLKRSCQEIFGRKTTPKIIKLTGESLEQEDYLFFDNLVLAALAKRLLSGDYLQEILSWSKKITLREEPFFSYNTISKGGLTTEEEHRTAKEFLKLFPEKKRLEFLHTVYHDQRGVHLLLDTIRILTDNRDQLVMPRRIRGLEQLHDDLAFQQRKLRNPDFSIELGDLADFEGAKIGDMTVHLPTSRYEIVQWGNELHNCIGSYAKEMRNGDCILLCLQRNGSPLYHVMLDLHGNVEQFYGDRNCPPFPPDREVFDKWLAPDNPLWNAAKKYSREARKVKPLKVPTI